MTAHLLRPGQVSFSSTAYPLSAPWPPGPQICFCESHWVTAGRVLQSERDLKEKPGISETKIFYSSPSKKVSMKQKWGWRWVTSPGGSVSTTGCCIVCMCNALHILMLIFVYAVWLQNDGTVPPNGGKHNNKLKQQYQKSLKRFQRFAEPFNDVSPRPEVE